MHISIQDTYLQLIKQGKKTAEGRIYYKKYTMLKVGENITFQSDHDTILAHITRLKRYPSFEKMIQDIGCQSLLPHINSIQEGIEIYRSFPNYKEREKKYGCVAIHISLDSY